MSDCDVAPRCPCGRTLRFHQETCTWACPDTLDAGDWGRPKKGHVHYFADEDWQAGRRPQPT